NELRQSDSARIYSASSKEASVSISADSTSLIVKPRLYGPVTITLGMEQDSVTLVYQSTNMPFPQISLGDAGYNVSAISHDQLDSAKGLKIRGDIKDASGLYNECILSCCELQIGDDFYSFSGDLFTEEIRNALSRLPEGEKVIVKRMILQVKSTGKTIKMDPASSFIVKN
ncbi:MAG TPA: hypothetical protein VK166_04815, partial [Chitinophagaceae bacterium]|nr:hypothetical protein [Chitinophagaceae bacterium]